MSYEEFVNFEVDVSSREGEHFIIGNFYGDFKLGSLKCFLYDKRCMPQAVRLVSNTYLATSINSAVQRLKIR
jgi:hypothetical protein